MSLPEHGTPDRYVDANTNGSGGGGPATHVIVDSLPTDITIDADNINLNTTELEEDMDLLIGKDFATQTTLASVLSTLGNILTQLQGTLNILGSVVVTSIPEVEIKNDAGNPIPVNGTVSVGNFPSSVEVSNDVGNPLPVNGTVNIGTVPEIEIKNDSGNPIPVSGTVTATPSGTQTVALDQTGDNNDVDVLNMIPAVETGLAKETTLLHKHGKVTSVVGTKSTASTTTIYTPTPGTTIRVCRVWIKAADAVPDNTPIEFILKLGDDEIDHDEVIRDQMYVNGAVREADAVDELMTLQLLAAQKVYFNVSIQEF